MTVPELRVQPGGAEIERQFAGCARNWPPAASSSRPRGTTRPRGWRPTSACGSTRSAMLDLVDVRWELGRFGKLNVRHGKGARRRGPKPRLVPLINGA